MKIEEQQRALRTRLPKKWICRCNFAFRRLCYYERKDGESLWGTFPRLINIEVYLSNMEVWDMNRLKGKHALITGASQGLGRQLAIDFAREGAAAIAIVARRAEALGEVRERIREAAPVS